MKTFFVMFLLVTVTQSGLAAPAAKKKPAKAAALTAAAVQEAVSQAKALMIQGQRKQALAQLDRAAALAAGKSDAAELRGHFYSELQSKKVLFAEQFLTTESFQKFQAARGDADAEHWDDCLRELEPIETKDQDNLMVVRLRANCHYRLKQYEAAAKHFQDALAVLGENAETTYSLVEIALAQRRYPAGLALLETAMPKTSFEIERRAILKAKLLELSGEHSGALEILREDQEAHLEHVEVLYELGMLYTRLPGHDWQARKTLSLFVSRCKRMKDAELKSRKLDLLVPSAQAALTELDKKLGV